MPKLFKSPSDMTLYSPGLRRANSNEINIIDKISNFVENIRLDTNKSNRDFQSAQHDKPGSSSGCDTRRVESISTPRTTRRPSGGYSGSPGAAIGNDHDHNHTPLASGMDPERMERATDHLLTQAEKFKARIEAPKGNNYTNMLMPYDYDRLRSKFVRPEGLAPIDSEILFLHNFDQDDEFFHVTSQIDPSLRIKIERSEFVELERLLPKDRGSSSYRSGNEEINKQLFQLITQGTNNYVDPPMVRAGKINSIHKWDQAFRVFTAIYTHANPERASEIWQYVYVIHTAAAANPWDNVYFYDINFCELMASKPWRSWAKTYTQGWNMAFNNSSVNFNTGTSTSNTNSANVRKKDWKDDCCWRYNKNRCKRSASECNYDHHCTYRAGWNHGFHNCRKRHNKGGGKRFSGGKSDHSPKGSNSPKSNN